MRSRGMFEFAKRDFAYTQSRALRSQELPQCRRYFLAKPPLLMARAQGAGVLLNGRRAGQAWRTLAVTPAIVDRRGRRREVLPAGRRDAPASGCARPPRPARLRTSRRAARRSVGARAVTAGPARRCRGVRLHAVRRTAVPRGTARPVRNGYSLAQPSAAQAGFLFRARGFRRLIS